MKSVLIVGYGIVGHNLAKELEKLQPDIYDKYKTEYNTKKDIKYDFAFICVDTPYVDKSNVCDITALLEAIVETNADILVIKSTILPGTTEWLNKHFPDKKIVFSPEFYGATQHCNNFEFNTTAIGGNKEWCYPVQQLLQEVYDARHSFRIVDSKVAETTKYVENFHLGLTVVECNSIKRMCDEIEIHYEDVRELWRDVDPRAPLSHTYVYDNHPFYDSHCLNKDIRAMAYTYNLPLANFIIDLNEKYKEEFYKQNKRGR